MSRPFRFKSFTIHHDRCAMKVSTDGILLGAWVPTPDAGPILDIGTGTGLIALMLAQRTGGQIPITALELEEDAAKQATENVAASPWPEAVSVIQRDIRDWSSDKLFQQIVSNPPYFANSLKAPDQARNLARHTDTLSFADLMGAVDRLAAPDAEFHCILPPDSARLLEQDARQTKWWPARRCEVTTRPGKPVSRVLLTLRKGEQPCRQSRLCIHDDNGDYAPEFIALTHRFYLKMPDEIGDDPPHLQ